MFLRPWFVFLSVPTAHEPFDAAPQYQNTFNGSKPPSLDFPNFNKVGHQIYPHQVKEECLHSTGNHSI